MNRFEIVLSIQTDADARRWHACAEHRAMDGGVLEVRWASGVVSVVDRPREKDRGRLEMVPIPVTEVELIGLALDAGMTIASDLMGVRIIEANTALNGMLKVGLHDWFRAGRLDVGEAAFVYSHDAWLRVRNALHLIPPKYKIRWVPSTMGIRVAESVYGLGSPRGLRNTEGSEKQCL
ncbi:hypothetical protein [Geothrix oryzae]|uniref:hypothetical protein n=1 Tax=Geothrix oryzae TaxID=2927975 RepID=UPI00257367A3|nr:hypothetical protein [Geothrix oryzae]